MNKTYEEKVVDLLDEMSSEDIAVLIFDGGYRTAIQKQNDSTWVYPGSSKEHTSEEIAHSDGLTRVALAYNL